MLISANQFHRRLPLSTSPSMAAPVVAVHSKLLASKVPAVCPFTVDNCGRSNHCSVSRRAKLASFTPVKHRGSLRRTLRIVAARTESADLPLGDKVPEFQLLEPLTGESIQLQNAQGSKGTLIVFMCNHCPFVVHLRDALVQLAKDISRLGVETIAISSNSDETQEVAHAYKAACTPEFYLADANLNLVYHGQFDDSCPANGAPATGKDVKDAVDSMLKGSPLQQPVRPSMGCGIKWHPSRQTA